MEQFFSIALPKWPSLVVTGTPVTKEQAKEILIRTDDITYISTNDLQFKRQCYEVILGRKLSNESNRPSIYDEFNDDEGTIDWEAYQAFESEVTTKYGTIHLNYLKNSQIASCFIGGPHGWCNWNGNIGTNSYNIGKWPSVEEVYEDWVNIANAFPYLNLQCQLFDGETSEEHTYPVIQFDVKDGQVEMSIPDKVIDNPSNKLNERITEIFINGIERGCTIEQFKDALEYTETQMKEK